MKRIFILLNLLILGFLCFAQTGKIAGSVKDGSQKTVESATITLHRSKDSAVAKVVVANKDGLYGFENIPDGRYFVSISAIGHTKGYSETFEVNPNNPSITLKTIELIPQLKQLSGVMVISRKPLIEQKIDRTIINVEASVTNVGSSALEVLEKSPGVTVDKDGNISLKGKQGVLVMLDGRPAYLSGSALSDYLKSLPASAIDQIEIMTQPSAKYDAAGNSGIINIKSKKNKQVGFNGSLTANYQQGIYWKSNNSLNLNYRTGKVNVFANFNMNKGNGFQQLDILRRFKDPATKNITAIFEQETNMRNRDLFSTSKTGADYFLNKNTTIGIVATGFTKPAKFSSQSTSFLKNNQSVIDSIVTAQSNINGNWKNGGINFNFRHQFDSTGKEISADVDYLSYRSNDQQNFTDTTYNPDWTLRHQDLLRSKLPSTINIYSAKVDYVQTLGKDVKMETGLKVSHVQTNNEANYFNVFTTGDEVDYSKTNNFYYKEDVNAAYVNLNKQYKKIGVQLGLRYEYTSYSGNQLGNAVRKDSSFTKAYGSLFPTLFVSYQANKDNQFAVSYGRRIDRPDYQDLNPFLFFLDQHTYQAGNPYLQPQFTNNFEITHTYKGFLTTSFNYSHTLNYMNETFEQAKELNGDKSYATVVRKGNIGEKNKEGISISAQVLVAKWWTAILYSNYNFSKFSGRLNGNGELINVDAANLLFNVNNQFRFSKGWTAELSGFYRTKGVEGQIIIQPMGMASVGISKQILKDKGTLKLNVRDLFYTNFPVGDINFENTMAHFENKRDSRVANFSFTYRFGKPIKGAQQKRKVGSAQDEQNRVRVGN